MAKIYMSVDGGGTKTEFGIFNAETEEYTSVKFSGSNYKYFDSAAETVDVADQFNAVIKEQNINRDDIAGVVFGLSGIDSEKDMELYRNVLKKTGIDEDRIILCNDCEYALRGNTEGDGIAALCGTGAITYGICGNRAVRTAGWGPEHSDLGSGTWIGSEAIKEAIQRLDEEMGEDDPIIGLMLRFKNDEEPLQQTINALDIPSAASIAKDVLELAQKGEPTCKDIVTEAAYNLAGYIRTTFNKMKFEGDELAIVYVGGVTNNEYFRMLLEPITQRMLGVKIKWILPTETPARAGINYIMREKG